MGIFLRPLQEEFGWSRASITFGQTISSLTGALFSPLFGLMIDRFGSRRLALPGAVLYCISFALLAFTNGSLLLWYGQWLLLATAFLAIKPTAWCNAVSSRFVRSRGLALAVTLSGVSVSAAIVPIITHNLVAEYGWRSAFVGLSGLYALVVLPLCYVYFYEAADRNTDGRRASRSEISARKAAQTGVGIKEALKSRVFLRLAVAGFAFGTAVLALTFHFVPLVAERGIDRGSAAAAAGLVGICSIIGRLTTGYLVDRFPPVRIATIAMSMPVFAAAALLMLDGSFPMAMLAAMLLGLSLGAELDVLTYLVTRHFGLRNFGTIFGFIVSVLSLSTALGPISASAVRDLTDSYDAVLWAVIPLFLIAAAAIATLGPTPDFDRKAD
jgi:predicted MFS family arabinose efflux permease